MYAIASVWIALGALITTIALILIPDRSAEQVVTLLPYTLAFSATLAAGVLWAFRKRKDADAAVAGQRLQAIAALLINSLSFAILLFTLLEAKYALAGLVLEYGFLWVCWWLYIRIVAPDERS
ncbi:MAG: hypothetical protein ACE5EC_04070 [Phycisphaerae bacterium]